MLLTVRERSAHHAEQGHLGWHQADREAGAAEVWAVLLLGFLQDRQGRDSVRQASADGSGRLWDPEAVLLTVPGPRLTEGRARVALMCESCRRWLGLGTQH